MKTIDFDYDLPEELIAQVPTPKRDESRLMVVHRDDSSLTHCGFGQMIDYLSAGDVLVINDTKVIPARLFAQKEGTGAQLEVLLLRQLSERKWETLVRPGRRAKQGSKLIFAEGVLEGKVEALQDGGIKEIVFQYTGDFNEILTQIGQVPLPPYIKTKGDLTRYQTVYAREPGSVAAPTAGLHFTPELLQRIDEKGVTIVPVLLHVGLGTFRPVTVEQVEDHLMHQEYYSITKEAADAIHRAKANGGKVVAVGTTSIRCLESAADETGDVKAGSGWTNIFIYPGYCFKVIDAIVTNFHLPCSTLLMLVSAFAGKEKILNAYKVAVQEKYRFFSFGDAMLIV